MVLDLYMPRLSGLEAAGVLRARFGRTIQLVAYSAWPAGEARKRALEAGFDAFIPKPSTPEDLLMIVSPEVRATIERSMEVNARQIALQLDLCKSYLQQAVQMREREAVHMVSRLIEERIHSIGERIVRQTVPGDLRDELQANLESLRRGLYGGPGETASQDE